MAIFFLVCWHCNYYVQVAYKIPDLPFNHLSHFWGGGAIKVSYFESLLRLQLPDSGIRWFLGCHRTLLCPTTSLPTLVGFSRARSVLSPEFALEASRFAQLRITPSTSAYVLPWEVSINRASRRGFDSFLFFRSRGIESTSRLSETSDVSAISTFLCLFFFLFRTSVQAPGFPRFVFLLLFSICLCWAF